MKTNILRALFALSVVAIFATCSDDQFESIAPDIRVYETSPDSPLKSLDFGMVAQKNTFTRSFYILDTVQNSADLTFTITLLDDAGNAAAQKLVSFSPDKGAVKGSKALKIDAAFTPPDDKATPPKQYSFKMHIESNSLTTANRKLDIPITGTGILPIIVIEKPVLDFGDVYLSSSSLLDTKIRNDGSGPLTISSVTILNPDNAFNVTDPNLTQLPIKIQPKTSITFSAIFSPLEIKAFTATYTLNNDDPNNRQAAISLKGNGAKPPENAPPVAKITCPAEGFQLPVPGELELDGTGTADPNGDQFAYLWTIAKDKDGKDLIPEGSDFCFDCNRGQLTRHKDSDKPKPTFYGDMVGDYTVQLVATDTGSPPLSSDPVTCVVHGYASQQLHIEMLWDNPVTDLDLHLVNNSEGISFVPPETGGLFTCPCDCNTNRNRNPDWGTRIPYTPACTNPNGNACDLECSPTFDPNCKIDPNDPATARNPICYKGGDRCVLTCEPDTANATYQAAVDDNPKLDIDDTKGYGPENINIVKPSPGLYRIFVHYFDDYGTGNSGATVRVYLNGKTKPEWKFGPTVLTKAGQLWEVAIITWPSSKTDDPLVTKVDAIRDAAPVWGAVCKLPGTDTDGGSDAADAAVTDAGTPVDASTDDTGPVD